MNSNTLKLVRGARWLVMPALVCCLCGAQARAQNDNAGAQTAPPAPAQTGQPPQPGGPVTPLLDELNLSPEQRAQLADIARQHANDVAALRQRIQAARRALNQAIYTDNPDQNIVNERTREVTAAQEALTRLNVQTEFRVRQVLTPEQFKLFRAIRRRQREAQRLRQQEQGQPDGLPRRPLRALPNPNRPPAAQPTNAGNPAPPDQLRLRRQRRPLPGAPRTPRP